MYNFDQVISRRNTNSVKWNVVEDDVLPMWVADMDFQSPPVIIEALQKRVEHGVFGYCASYGGWFDALIKWMDRRHGWHPEAGWISTSPGVMVGIYLLIQALTEPGDKIIIQPPVYGPFHQVARSNACELIENPLYFDGNKYRMDLEHLKQVIDPKVRLLILCSPHNPVGRVWDQEELTALGQFCLEHEITIISDEIHADLVFPDYKHRVLTSISKEMEQNMIVCNAPTKTFNIPGIPASNIIIPNKELRSAYRKVLKSSSLFVPDIFAVTAVEAAYTYGEHWLNELLLYLQKNYEFAAEFLAKNIPEVKLTRPEGTYLLWLDFSELGLADDELDAFIKEKARIMLEPGTNFGRGGSGFLRMNIACPHSVLSEALTRLRIAIKG